ncbi:hypothetical protein [Limnohabitans sp. Rim8]|uniref:hypothetical protein n=1 Tax=Limnohabitans sp. Rim8 TaxID=1100718 RepID=UPI0033062772
MIHLFISRFVCAGLTASLLVLMPLPAWAGPGAHGPNGEHLDAPMTGKANAMQASLQVEANSDLFELVATLTSGELSIFIDRFASNEPVLQAQVEVESGGLKAQAKFHADRGHYAIDDRAMLQKLSTPGEHPLVITVLAGKDSDLLDAVLRVPAALAVDDHHFHWEWWALGALATLVLLGMSVARLRKQRQRRFSLGGQA